MTDTHRSGQHTGNTQADQDQTAIDRARAATSDAGRRAADAVEANPLGVLAGGLALGALAGALIPRSDKEKELLAPVGKRLGEGARAAVQAAKDAGKTELESRGFTADAGREQVKNLLGGLGKAASSAGAAAAKSARGKSDQNAGENQPA